MASSNNLSDIASTSSARTNLGLGSAAVATINTTAGTITADGTQIAGSTGLVADAGHVHPALGWIPGDNALLTATDSPTVYSSTTTPVAGTLYLAKLPVRAALTATNIWVVGGTGGSGSSTGSYVGLYSSSGSLLSGSSDIGSQFTTSAVSRQIALTTAQSLTSGFVWVAFLVNLPTTQPTLRGLNNGTVLPNIGLSAATYRFCTNGIGLTTLPNSITPTSNTAPSLSPIWLGVS